MYEIADESTHLIITKPRFPMFKKWDSYYQNLDFEAQHEYLKSTWKECYRILVNGGICCIIMSDITRNINKDFVCYPNCAKTTTVCRELGFKTLIPIYCQSSEKRQTSFLGSGFLPVNAYVKQELRTIIILRKGKLRKFKRQTEIENRKKSTFSKEERNLWFSQLWTIPRQAKLNDISEEVVYRLIRMFSVTYDLIVDPFSESNTIVGHTALQLDRNFLGYLMDDREGKSTILTKL